MYQEQLDVREFHRAMGIADSDLTSPGVPSDKVVRLRGRLVAEECFELLEAMFVNPIELNSLKRQVMKIIDQAAVIVDLPGVADAIADAKYVLDGTNLAFGIDGQAIWEEVHRANMRKVGGPVSREGKQLKPLGWVPPDIPKVLIDQGWTPK